METTADEGRENRHPPTQVARYCREGIVEDDSGVREHTSAVLGRIVVPLTDKRVLTVDRTVRWAARLLDRAIEDATAIGLADKVDQWTTARAALRVTAADVAPLAIRREAVGRWLVTSRTHRALVGDLVGMHYLARLLASPGVPISAVDLAGRGGHVAVLSNQTMLDEQARAAYTTRARQLAAELAEARENADRARAERLGCELDALTTELDRAVGLGGRLRQFTGPAERARTAVRKAIKRAIDAVHAAAPDLAALLDAGITTGHHCHYDPTVLAKGFKAGFVRIVGRADSSAAGSSPNRAVATDRG